MRLLAIDKTKIKKKEAGMARFIKRSIIYWAVVVTLLVEWLLLILDVRG